MKEAPRTYRWSYEIMLAIALEEKTRFPRHRKDPFLHMRGRRGKRPH